MLDKKPDGPEPFDSRIILDVFDATYGRIAGLARTVGGRALALPRSVIDSLPIETPEIPEAFEDLEDSLRRFRSFHAGESDTFVDAFRPNEHLDSFVAAIQEEHGLNLTPKENEQHSIFIPQSVGKIVIDPQFDGRANAITEYFYTGTWAS